MSNGYWYCNICNIYVKWQETASNCDFFDCGHKEEDFDLDNGVNTDGAYANWENALKLDFSIITIQNFAHPGQGR